MKKIVVLSLVALGGLYLLKKTNAGSYICTAWGNGRTALQRQVPRSFELDRVRNEIAKLDADIVAMLDPIAEKKWAVQQLERQVKAAQDGLTTRRTALAALAQKVEAGEQRVSFDNEQLSLNEAKARLANDFARLKADDGLLKSRRALLDAQKKTLQTAEAKLSQMRRQQAEFAQRLATLEAAEEDLTLKAITTPLRLDQSRVAEIKNTLDNVQKSQEIEAIKRSLEERFTNRQGDPAPEQAPTVDLNEIRQFLGDQPCCPEAPKVAKSK